MPPAWMARSPPGSGTLKRTGEGAVRRVRLRFTRPALNDEVDLMLVDIAKLPTAENSAIHLHPSDNIAVARVPLSAGAELRIDGLTVVALDAVPAGHKIAIRAIDPGEMVRRYG